MGAHPNHTVSVGNGQSAIWDWWFEFEARRAPRSSWADTLPMIQQRHPQVADHILVSLSQDRGGFHLEAAGESRNRLMNAGVDAPEWGDVDRSQRPGYHPDDEFPRFLNMGWQSFASTKIQEVFFGTNVWPRTELWCAQRGPWPASHSTHHVSLLHPVSTLSVPECFFCVAFGASSLEFRNLPVWPATRFSWPPLGSLRTAGGFGSPRVSGRVVRHGSAGKQEQGCPSTSVSKTWTFFQGQEQTTVVWKWSLMVCLSFTAHSWPWTPRWSALSELTELPGGSVQNGMEPLWTKPVAPKSAPTQN